jgi:hypothetical protein
LLHQARKNLDLTLLSTYRDLLQERRIYFLFTTIAMCVFIAFMHGVESQYFYLSNQASVLCYQSFSFLRNHLFHLHQNHPFQTINSFLLILDVHLNIDFWLESVVGLKLNTIFIGDRTISVYIKHRGGGIVLSLMLQLTIEYAYHLLNNTLWLKSRAHVI